jgi:SAM-dependent methyltransferase
MVGRFSFGRNQTNAEHKAIMGARMTVADIFRADFKRFSSSISEFPVTDMSSEVAHAITRLPPFWNRPESVVLDVGTGSGLHAAAMAVNGARTIIAIDISPAAIAAAEQRFGRIHQQLSDLVGSPVAIPSYQICDMSALDLELEYDLICTNPPSFFRHGRVGTSSDTAMDLALFDGDVLDGQTAEASFLYRFFANVVTKHLAVGGTVICGWPAIERRIADDIYGRLVHPTTRLHEWFGFAFESQIPNAERFFSKTAHVRNYGNDGELLNAVFRDIHLTDIYSKSLIITDEAMLTFRYGVLGLSKVNTGTYAFA